MNAVPLNFLLERNPEKKWRIMWHWTLE